jgi:hypothetical protein
MGGLLGAEYLSVSDAEVVTLSVARKDASRFS